MKLEWDEVKRVETLLKHGLDFARCDEIFADVTVEYPDDREDYGEVRMIAIGFLEVEMVTIVYTDTPSARRIITMWRATRRERRIYEKNFGLSR